MTSMPSPKVFEFLAEIGVGLDDLLQADGYLVESISEMHAAFDESWFETAIVRALVSYGVKASTQGFVRPMPNGGAEVVVVDGEVERSFRVRIATRDGKGLKILAGSDSLFAHVYEDDPQGTLFPKIRPTVRERWILALVIDRSAISLQELVAVQALGFMRSVPGRLLLGTECPVAFLRQPPPVRFQGDDEDLDFGEGTGEGSGDDF